MSHSEDLEPSPSFSLELQRGLSVVVVSSCLSCAAVLLLLVYIAFQTFRNRAPRRRHSLKSHMGLYFLALLLSDLVQSINGMMNIKWVVEAGVHEGPFCVAQGALCQLGAVGVALCSLTIAFHTFGVIVLRWKESSSLARPIVILSLYAVFLTLIVGLGYAVHRNSVYFGNTTYWCWITKRFIAEGIALEYVWLWFAAFINFVLYVPLFLALKRIILVEPTGTWIRYRVVRSTREGRENFFASDKATETARRMLWYPAIYTITVLPIAVTRIHAFLSTKTVPPAATFFSAVLFYSSGLFNALLFTITRPALLRPYSDRDDRVCQLAHCSATNPEQTISQTSSEHEVGMDPHLCKDKVLLIR